MHKPNAAEKFYASRCGENGDYAESFIIGVDLFLSGKPRPNWHREVQASHYEVQGWDWAQRNGKSIEISFPTRNKEMAEKIVKAVNESLGFVTNPGKCWPKVRLDDRCQIICDEFLGDDFDSFRSYVWGFGMGWVKAVQD